MTGLDIQPGRVVAAEVSVNGGIVVERAAMAELEPGLLRDGEVIEPDALGARLKSFFRDCGLPSRVRVGLASPQAVVRTIDLPPIEDAGDLAAAVRTQAPDHFPMSLDRAVIDHHLLGIVDTPAGRRARVVVAAAQREPVDSLLAALRRASLRPAGIDLSAFALVRALHDRRDESAVPTLYAQVGGVTVVAVAEGSTCHLTRIAAIDLETLAERAAERAGEPLTAARARVASEGLESEDEVLREVLVAGVAQLGHDLHNTIEFATAQWGLAPIAEIVLTGAAVAVPGFVAALEGHVGVPVRIGTVAEARQGAFDGVDASDVTIAAGLAVEDLPGVSA